MPDQGSHTVAVASFWEPTGADDVSSALTCDVEDYFQVSAFENLSPRSEWLQKECRIPRNVDRILELYAEAGATGTFFVLGWVAQHYPEIVRRISEAGHEVASHGMEHIRVWKQTAGEYRADVSRSKRLLEDVTGRPVLGYRAASWSIDLRALWAHDVLADEGYEYSSSIYPISHDHFGLPDAPIRPFYVRGSGLLEVPASTARVLGRNVPAAGGGFFRLFPYTTSRWLARRAKRTIGAPYVFYYHPWELDADQPRMAGVKGRSRFRHYVNLRQFEPRFARLLREFRWGRMDKIYLGSS